MNRLDHGLRSAGSPLPTEDVAAFQAHMDAWMDDWKPQTMARRELVEKLAFAAWRRQRVVRVETARLAERADAALKNFDRRERTALKRDAATLLDDPARGLAALRSSRAGVERLVAMWAEIAEAVAEPGRWLYGDAHHETLLALMGMDEDDGDEPAAATIGASWRLLLHDRPDVDREGDVPCTDEEAAEVRAWIARRAPVRDRAPRRAPRPPPRPRGGGGPARGGGRLRAPPRGRPAAPLRGPARPRVPPRPRRPGTARQERRGARPGRPGGRRRGPAVAREIGRNFAFVKGFRRVIGFVRRRGGDFSRDEPVEGSDAPAQGRRGRRGGLPGRLGIGLIRGSGCVEGPPRGGRDRGPCRGEVTCRERPSQSTLSPSPLSRAASRSAR